MTDTPHTDRCIICNGTREEHGDRTKHAFTLTPGDLRPLAPQVAQRPEVRSQGISLRTVTALIEVLVDKGVITPEEGLSCFGVKAAIHHDPSSSSV